MGILEPNKESMSTHSHPSFIIIYIHVSGNKGAYIIQSYMYYPDVFRSSNPAKVQINDRALSVLTFFYPCMVCSRRDGKKVQVGKDQEKAQSEKDSHSKNRGGKKPN